MAVLGMSEFQDAMKTWYLDAINDQTARFSIMLNRLEGTSEGVGGNFSYMSLLTRGNQGIGSRGDNATLPTAGFAKVDKATFGMKTVYGRGKITGKTLRATEKGKRAAFAEALDLQMKQLQIEVPVDLNRQLWGKGRGDLTIDVVNTAQTNKSTVTVGSTQYFHTSMRVDVVNATSGATVTGGDSVTINNVLTSAVVLSTTVTTGTGFTIVREDSHNQEIYGFRNIFSTANPPTPVTNFGGIDRTAAGKSFWQANVLHNSGTLRPLSMGLMHQAVMKGFTRGRGKTSLIVADPDMWTTYGVLLAPDRRFGPMQMELDGGFTALKFNDIPFGFDPTAPPNEIYFFEEDSFMLFEYESGFSWLSVDGLIIRNVADKDQWDFTLLKDMQVGCSHPNRQTLLKDIEVNVA